LGYVSRPVGDESGAVIDDLAAGIATEWTIAKTALIIEALAKEAEGESGVVRGEHPSFGW
jgi:hypothetical protein